MIDREAEYQLAEELASTILEIFIKNETYPVTALTALTVSLVHLLNSTGQSLETAIDILKRTDQNYKKIKEKT